MTATDAAITGFCAGVPMLFLASHTVNELRRNDFDSRRERFQHRVGTVMMLLAVFTVWFATGIAAKHAALEGWAI